eukprot:TRINITY_DN6432_c0_g2_i1.p1 TRINITY_DN6432_c0_g2~~TRINITY_DN6432_c0_g2_i1.p1  ORF type:complete len:218 (-),score=43.04 TRINITY_DN6432_c0_g2_i1:260-913(-)
MARNRPQRVNCMDLSPFIERLNLQRHDALADSDSDSGDAVRTPQRRNCMDLSPFVRRLSLHQHYSHDACSDSGLDAPEACRTPRDQEVNVLPEADSSEAMRNHAFFAEEPRALVSQERSQWLNVHQEFAVEYEEMGHQEIEAAIVTRTSTVAPGEMDFAAEFDWLGEWDETWNDKKLSGKADDAPHDLALLSTSEYHGEACSSDLASTAAPNAASGM